MPQEEMTEEVEVDEVIDAPRHGTLLWLDLQEHTTYDGLEIPACHRLPEGSTLHPEIDGRCRCVKPSGERCAAPATRRYGICLVHAGGGGFDDPAAMARKAHASKAKLRARRQLLGIGPRRGADPRQIARVAAAERADEVAAALLAPLDDSDLSSLARQRAAQVILGETFPIQTTTVEVELPLDGEGVAALSWQDMQVLASKLLDAEPVSHGVPAELEPSSHAA